MDLKTTAYELDLDNLNILAKEIVKHKNCVIILDGDLASGKTTLVREVVKELGIEDDVSSPTFSLQQCYGENIFHYDIYNNGIEHFLALGMLEELEKDGMHFIEWGDEKLQLLLKNAEIATMVIKIEKSLETKRYYKVNYVYS